MTQFFLQEIDGPSLLLMKRNDVVRNMGLKLGPAVKMYTHIRRLQTRRADLLFA
jgi:SAM domain (Sterile alpha motif)